jgi:5-methylcytosine-specific restriction endonuclease McrA
MLVIERVSLWGEESWRKPVPKAKRELLLLKQKGKCARCRRNFASMRVKPVLHHTGKSNQIRSMQLLCPNCHSKAHEFKVKEGDWGATYTVVKRRKFGKKKTVKKRKKKKKTSENGWFW